MSRPMDMGSGFLGIPQDSSGLPAGYAEGTFSGKLPEDVLKKLLAILKDTRRTALCKGLRVKTSHKYDKDLAVNHFFGCKELKLTGPEVEWVRKLVIEAPNDHPSFLEWLRKLVIGASYDLPSLIIELEQLLLVLQDASVERDVLVTQLGTLNTVLKGALPVLDDPRRLLTLYTPEGDLVLEAILATLREKTDIKGRLHHILTNIKEGMPPALLNHREQEKLYYEQMAKEFVGSDLDIGGPDLDKLFPEVSTEKRREGFFSRFEGVKDERLRSAVLEYIAVRHARVLMEHLSRFGITDARYLVKLATVMAEQQPSEIEYHISHFHFDEKTRAEIAEIAVRSGNFHIYFADSGGFGIRDHDTLMNLATMAASKGRFFPPQFGITEQRDVVELLKISVQAGFPVTLENVRHYYGITEPALLKDFANFMVDNDKQVCEFIQESDRMKDLPKLIAIAQRAARRNPADITANIQKFGIRDPSLLRDIALIALEKDPITTIRHIGNYHLNEDDIVTMALSVLDRAREETIDPYVDLLGTIGDCCVRNGVSEKSRITILLHVAKGPSLSAHVKRFLIKDEATLVRLAQITVKQDAYGVSCRIEDYDIKDEKARIAIAKEAAAVLGMELYSLGGRRGASTLIDNYEISDRAALAEIRRIAEAKG